MVHAIQYAREHKIPFFGICLGMQCATIEYARDVAGLKQADSSEFDPRTPHRVIYKLRELLGVDEMGGTMRLGAWLCTLEPGSLAHKAYGTLEISERHRHRYEFNRDYEKTLVGAGLRITGRTPDENYVEIIEAPEHPWFLGCQFHPEFKSKPLEPHPLFAAFVGAALENKKQKTLPAPAPPLLSLPVLSSMLRMTTPREIPLGSLRLGGGNPLFLIAGPCVIESEKHARKIAEQVMRIAADAGIPYIYKASYDKANRSSVKSVRSPGLKERLRILRNINEELNIS